MFKTSHTIAEKIQQNPIHIDSKWFKEVITITGSVEASLILSDCIIYHHNKYRGFSVDDRKQFGLLTSLSEIQRSYHISYKRAKQVLQELLDRELIKIHNQGFVYNQKFYTPTDKALDIIYKLQIQRKNSLSPNEIKVEPPLAIDQSTFSDRQNSYKDKNKDKKNNNHNTLLKNCSLLENSKPQNVKTVIFDFNKFQLENIKCEATILDYFTVKQSEVINTVTFCYHDNLDIVTFNQILNRPDLKKEAKDFKQLVTWAYFESTKEKRVIADDKAESECHDMAKNRTLSVSPKTDHQTAIILPNITADKIQEVIDQRQKNQTYIADGAIENETSDNKKIISQNTQHTEISQGKSKQTSPPQSAYLLTQSNQLHLIETLSEKGINDAALIVKTAENILDEYAKLSFNDLLDGIIYRLGTLPEKQKQQELINQALPMEIDRETTNVINTDDMEKTTDKASENNKNITTNWPHQYLPMALECMPRKIVESEKIQEKMSEHPNNIDKEPVPDSPNKFNPALLIESLNAVGIEDEKLILDSATTIMVEYPDIEFRELIDGVIYRLVTLPSKQKKKDEINQLLLAEFTNVTDSKKLEFIGTVTTNKPKPIQANDTLLPQPSDLTMPDVDTYRLRQNWASKADQKFYTGILPDSQQLALVAMIDYVKRKGITITVEQEVYEWLYHMASNKDYYYSKASNFKHWCNIVMRQLMQRRLHKPAGFDGWRSRIEAGSLSVVA